MLDWYLFEKFKVICLLSFIYHATHFLCENQIPSLIVSISRPYNDELFMVNILMTFCLGYQKYNDNIFLIGLATRQQEILAIV